MPQSTQKAEGSQVLGQPVLPRETLSMEGKKWEGGLRGREREKGGNGPSAPYTRSLADEKAAQFP